MGSLVTFVFQVCFVFKRSYVVGMEARQAQEEEEIFPAVAVSLPLLPVRLGKRC